MERIRACLAGSVLISGKGSRMVFSHDGLRDSLTRVAAPPFFYESLKREISLSERNQSAITAMTFKLESKHTIDDYPLIAFAEIAARAIRLEDHIARMSINSFILLITGDIEVAEQIASRISSLWTLEGIPAISLHYAWVSHQVGESALEFLNRLDGEALITSSF
jgi:GGDEF domain-containing protein